MSRTDDAATGGSKPSPPTTPAEETSLSRQDRLALARMLSRIENGVLSVLSHVRDVADEFEIHLPTHTLPDDHPAVSGRFRSHSSVGFFPD